MTPEEFVIEFKELKDNIQNEYFRVGSDISRVDQLIEAGLNTKQIELVKSVVGEALTDALYTVLMGIEGETSISQYQESYKLFSEAGMELTGEIESLAWEHFHEQDS